MKPAALLSALQEHSFLQGLSLEQLTIIASCSDFRTFAEGEYLSREGTEATHFYLLRQGRVSIDIPHPLQGTAILQTLSDGDVLGWSWLLPPYITEFSGRALIPTDTLALEAAPLRQALEADPSLGLPLLKLFTQAMVRRLRAARFQLLDMYRHHS